jgi:ubiquinone/menaquinone biosynthesis C-methylase UbiE
VPGLVADEIERIFAPFVVERLRHDDPKWLDVMRRLEKRYGAAVPSSREWLNAEGHRTPGLVKDGYEAVWGRISLEAEVTSQKTAYFEWGSRCSLAHAIGRKRVHQLCLARVIDWLQPSSVLEVGFGYGLNLLMLSMLFPSVSFSGVELTRAGVEAAAALAADATTAAVLEPFAVSPLRDRHGPRRLVLREGPADALPLPDKSVDMAITVLALEQMERVREAALVELARVARRHVVMIEPFADWNREPHRRGYIAKHDYFAASVDDLRRVGLTPLVATADMPNKLQFRAGVVVASVAEGRA